MIESYTLTRDSQSDLRFEGELLAYEKRSDRNRQNYKLQFTLYRTAVGKLVGHYEYHPLVGGPKATNIALVADDVAALATMVAELVANPFAFGIGGEEHVVQMFKDALETADLEWIEEIA